MEGPGGHAFKATRDPLTGLFNRGVIVDLFAPRWFEPIARAACAVVLLEDMEHFTKRNDTHGQASATRPSEKSPMGSWGGSFLRLRGTFPAEVPCRAKRLRRLPGALSSGADHRAVSAAPVRAAGNAISVTISLGVMATKDWGLLAVEEVIDEADAALYRAKADGRNCVRFANPSATQPE